MNVVDASWAGVAVVLLAERLAKWAAVVAFFRRPPTPSPEAPRLVSVLTPVVGGDPLLATGLAENLAAAHPYPVEFLWLLDEDDAVAATVCAGVSAKHPAATVRVIAMPPPGPRESPKTFKLIRGLEAANGDVICVLDDDTVLPDDALPQVVGALAKPGVGLAFGLPYYVSFGNFWSRPVAYFVNSHSLLTYLPPACVVEPYTINGMFYAMRREVLRDVGDFRGIEHILADDFAIANLFRGRGYRLAQTAVRHAIRTTVDGPRAYARLLQRWFVFPRETLMRGLDWRSLAVSYFLTLLPALVPLLVALGLAAFPSWWGVAALVLYVGVSYAMFAHFNAAYLRRASPWRWSWLVPLVQLALPLQVLVAMVLPQRVLWRGNIMRIERGGTFTLERRRTP